MQNVPKLLKFIGNGSEPCQVRLYNLAFFGIRPPDLMQISGYRLKVMHQHTHVPILPAPRLPPRGKVALFCPSLLEDDIVKICQHVQFSQRLGFVQSVWIDWSAQFLP